MSEGSVCEAELVLCLDEPVDGATRLVRRFAIRGWCLLRGALEGIESIPNIEVILEEHTRARGELEECAELLGEVLEATPSGSAIRVSSLSVKESERTVELDGRIVKGSLFDIEGIMDFEGLPDGPTESSRMFSLRLCARLGARIVFSNRALITLAASGMRSQAFGGFVSPVEGPVFSEFVQVEGWADRLGDEVKSVVIRLNGQDYEEARYGFSSPDQHAALPDPEQSQKCRFLNTLQRSKLLAQGWSEENLAQPLNISAYIQFGSGAELVLDAPPILWSQEPCREEESSSLFGSIESVEVTAKGLLRLRGWLVRAGLGEPQFTLVGARAKVVVNGPQVVFEHTTWHRRPDIASKYPSLACDEPEGFAIEVPPNVFGKYPGLIRLEVEDLERGERVSIGPKGMWEVISELVEGTLPKTGLLEGAVRAAAKRAGRLSAVKAQEALKTPTGSVSKNALRILVGSHNLSAVEGAPKVLFQVISSLVKEKGIEAHVVSPRDGDLRRSFEELGVGVSILGELDVFRQTWPRYHCGMGRLLAEIEKFSPNLVYANVIDAFWAIDAAYRCNLASAWAIHESIEPEYWFSELDNRFRIQFLHHLTHSRKLIFVSEETRDLFLSVVSKEKTCVIPNGIDTEEINRVCRELSRNSARRQLGIGEEEIAVSVVGTTAYRKGQDVFLREMALLLEAMPGRSFRFFVVGARKIDFLETLYELSRSLGIEGRVVFVPETPDVSCYFRASDIMVVSSREESSPLVSLEAFAYGVPLVSTRVYGLARQIQDESTALAFDLETPGDLARQVQRLINEPDLREQIVAGGRAAVDSEFSFRKALARYFEVLTDCFTEVK